MDMLFPYITNKHSKGKELRDKNAQNLVGKSVGQKLLKVHCYVHVIHVLTD